MYQSACVLDFFAPLINCQFAPKVSDDGPKRWQGGWKTLELPCGSLAKLIQQKSELHAICVNQVNYDEHDAQIKSCLMVSIVLRHHDTCSQTTICCPGSVNGTNLRSCPILKNIWICFLWLIFRSFEAGTREKAESRHFLQLIMFIVDSDVILPQLEATTSFDTHRWCGSWAKDD